MPYKGCIVSPYSSPCIRSKSFGITRNIDQSSYGSGDTFSRTWAFVWQIGEVAGSAQDVLKELQ